MAQRTVGESEEPAFASYGAAAFASAKTGKSFESRTQPNLGSS